MDNKYVIDAIVEIPFGSRNKYETDKKNGRIRLDRVLYSAMGYPTEYGIIENTLADDGDPPAHAAVLGIHRDYLVGRCHAIASFLRDAALVSERLGASGRNRVVVSHDNLL